MNIAARKTEHGGATLVVGDRDAAELLSRVGVSSRVLSSYLEVLGEMGRGTVRQVIGRLGPMGGDVESTVAALRRLDPAVRLVLVIDPIEEPDAMRAVRLGFDDYVVRPINPKHLLAALESPEKHGVNNTPPDPASIPPAPFDAVAIDAPPSLGTLSPGTADDETRLIDHLLQRRGEITPRLLDVIRHRLGETAVNFTPEEPAGGAAAAVRYGEQALGYLAAPGRNAADLAGHAAWMGRWLVMERHLGQLSDMAMKDELTGVWNRRYFTRTLESILQRARRERFHVTLMLFDIDDFKLYNDRYGHTAGDEILREAARLMGSVVRRHDIVARVGGDEFAVIFWDAEPRRDPHSEHPRSVRTAAARFQHAVYQHRFPKLGDEAPGTLTISGGLASFPWDGQTADELIEAADRMALQGKRDGKNTVKLGPGAERLCGSE